jgi:diaphanous 1
MGLKGEKRTRMYELSPTHKKYLLEQHRGSRSNTTPSSIIPSQNSQPSYSVSYGPSSGSALLPRLVPQLTGDAGLMRRFSLSGWGAGGTAPPLVSSEPDRSSGEFASSAIGRGKAQVEKVVEELQPIQPQTTGGLWSSWWASSGGERVASSQKSGTKETSKLPKSYVEGLRADRSLDTKLVKHLISLRVLLSTAKLAWIEEFTSREKGLDALGTLLAGLVGKGGKRWDLNEVETAILLELVKCLRVLLNTEVSLHIANVGILLRGAPSLASSKYC